MEVAGERYGRDEEWIRIHKKYRKILKKIREVSGEDVWRGIKIQTLQM